MKNLLKITRGDNAEKITKQKPVSANKWKLKIKMIVYVLFAQLLLFISLPSRAQQAEQLTCPKAEVIQTFIEAIRHAGDMETVRYRFTKLFSAQAKDTTLANIHSSCWSLQTIAEFNHPLRAINLSTSDNVLEKNKNGLLPKVQEQFCLTAAAVFDNFEWFKAPIQIKQTDLKKSLFNFPSLPFTKINIQELNGCLISIELSAIQI